MLITKKYLEIDLWNSNAATFHGIFAIQDDDRSTKPVVIVLVMSYLLEILLRRKHEQ